MYIIESIGIIIAAQAIITGISTYASVKTLLVHIEYINQKADNAHKRIDALRKINS